MRWRREGRDESDERERRGENKRAGGSREQNGVQDSSSRGLTNQRQTVRPSSSSNNDDVKENKKSHLIRSMELFPMHQGPETASPRKGTANDHTQNQGPPKDDTHSSATLFSTRIFDYLYLIPLFSGQAQT